MVYLIRPFEIAQCIVGIGLNFIPYYIDILQRSKALKAYMAFQFIYGATFWLGGNKEGFRLFQFLHLIAAIIEFASYIYIGGYPTGWKTTFIWTALFLFYLFTCIRFGCGGYSSAYTRGEYKVGVREFWGKRGMKVIMYYPIDKEEYN